MNAQIKAAALSVARELFTCEEAAASAALPIARAMAALLQPKEESYWWPLFSHMTRYHSLILLDSEMDDIARVVRSMGHPLGESATHGPELKAAGIKLKDAERSEGEWRIRCASLNRENEDLAALVAAKNRELAALQQPPAILPQPTGPGMWWALNGSNWECVNVFRRNDSGLRFWRSGCPFLCSEYTQWSGPLLPPDAVQPRFGSVSNVERELEGQVASLCRACDAHTQTIRELRAMLGSVSGVAAAEEQPQEWAERVLGPEEIPRKGDWRVWYNVDGSEQDRWEIKGENSNPSPIKWSKVIRRTPRTLSDEVEASGA